MVKRVLMAVIAISVLVSCYVLFNRYNAEKRVGNVEIAVDLTAFQDLAGEIGTEFMEQAQELKKHGATSIAVHEVSLLDLKNRGDIAYMPLSDLIMGSYTAGTRVSVVQEIITRYNAKINKRKTTDYSVVITQDKNMLDFLYKALDKRTGHKVEKFQSGNSYAIIIGKNVRALNNLGMGFLEKDLEYAKSLGFQNIIPRIQNYHGIDKDDIENKIKQVEKYNVSTVIFEGEEVLGNNESDKAEEMLKYAAKRFAESGLITAIIEKPAEEDINKVQKGIKLYSKESKYTSSKVFSIEVQKKNNSDISNFVEQWSRAIVERNVRIIYVRPIIIPNKEANQNFDDTLEALSVISHRIDSMGLKRDVVKGLGDIYPSSYERLILFAGIIAGCLLLLLNFIQLKKYVVYGIMGLYFLGASCIIAIDMFRNIFGGAIGDFIIKAAALTGAIIFPSLAMLYIINLYSKLSKEHEQPIPLMKIITRSAGMLISAIGIALIGGLMVASLLAESKYMLKLDIFRGVKLAFISPLIIYVILYIKNIGIYSDKDDKPIKPSLQLKKLLNTSVTVKYVLAGAAVSIVVIILLLRSGNAPAGLASGAELKFRAALETLLVARPRSKELLTFPIFMLLGYASMKKYKVVSFFIMLAGVIGLADVVNSFSHIRMELQIASLSTIFSLAFSIIIGISLLILWKIVEDRYYKYYNRRREAH